MGIAKDNTHKINKVEQNIKTIENMQKEINNHKDETSDKMKDMKNNVDANTKNISATNSKIQDIYSTLDTISRELATKIATNISDDNPDPLGLTYACIAAKEPIPIKPTIIKEKTPAEQQKDKLRQILHIARKRVSLKPVRADHISQNIPESEINNPDNHKICKTAAIDFLEKELKVTTAEVKSSKLSSTSSILWIEVQDSKTVAIILRQSAYFRREAKAIIYPPQE